MAGEQVTLDLDRELQIALMELDWRQKEKKTRRISAQYAAAAERLSPATYLRTILIGWPYYLRLYQEDFPRGKLIGLVFRSSRLSRHQDRTPGSFWAMADVIMVKV